MSTAIEWATDTWNPVTGCTKVSPGCANCYIERTPAFRMAGRRFVNGNIPVQLHPERLEIPLRWRRPRMVFTCSMADLFHEDVPIDFLRHVFRVMEYTPQHTYQVLTKRPERVLRDWKEYLLYPPPGDTGIRFKGDAMAQCLAGEKIKVTTSYRWPPNVWLGVSVENQRWADERIPLLLETPAAVRFLSCEPLLGSLNLKRCLPTSRTVFGRRIEYEGIDWVIVGGESGGPENRRLVERCDHSGDTLLARYDTRCAVCRAWRNRAPGWLPKPEALEWLRSIRDQCQAAGMPMFFKQWGGPRPKSGGRLLDGREHNEMPQREAVHA